MSNCPFIRFVGLVVGGVKVVLKEIQGVIQPTTLEEEWKWSKRNQYYWKKGELGDKFGVYTQIRKPSTYLGQDW
jgi:hypothetical protein